LAKGKRTTQEIPLSPWAVKRKIAFEKRLYFQVQIEDLALKWGILREKPEKQEYRRDCRKSPKR